MSTTTTTRGMPQREDVRPARPTGWRGIRPWAMPRSLGWRRLPLPSGHWGPPFAGPTGAISSGAGTSPMDSAK